MIQPTQPRAWRRGTAARLPRAPRQGREARCQPLRSQHDQMQSSSSARRCLAEMHRGPSSCLELQERRLKLETAARESPQRRQPTQQVLAFLLLDGTAVGAPGRRLARIGAAAATRRPHTRYARIRAASTARQRAIRARRQTVAAAAWASRSRGA
eukprot:6205686-Pleurochrysis_carterae.AAC.5